MRKIVLIVVVLMTNVMFASAAQMLRDGCDQQAQQNEQQKNDRQKHHEQIQAMKVGYITEKVGLNTAESEKFWPLYNQYWNERREAARALKQFYNRVEKNEVTASDLTILLTLQESENGIIRRWADKFKTVLTPEKIAKMFVAEESFKWYLMNQKR